MKEKVVENSKERVKIAYGSEKQVEVYSEKEVERIVFYIQNEEKVSKRNKVIVILLLYTGVRVSELCSIKIKDIDFRFRISSNRSKRSIEKRCYKYNARKIN